jgi:signal transduction histidine kinase
MMCRLQVCTRSLTARLQAIGALSRFIQNPGESFDPMAEFNARYGLESMRERASRLGSRLRVVSTPGSGTQVTVAVARLAT